MTAVVDVRTVRGPVRSDRLGLTLTHEHLANDARRAVGPPREERFADLRDATVVPELAWALREEPYACLDHCVLDGHEDVLAELVAFGAVGGGTVVDVTPPGLGRDPERLRDLAARSGVAVVMGSGWYLEDYHPPGLDRTAEVVLSSGLVAEIGTVGGPGVIGEIGVSPRFTTAEQHALRASARAQRETGVPLFVHLPGWQRRAHEVLDLVLGEYGVTPGAVVLCHMDPSGADRDYQRSVADRGVRLEFDMIGMPFLFPGEGQAPPPADTAAAVAGLVADGHAERLLLSHDLFLKTMLRRFGGNGLTYVPTHFRRRLVEEGVDAEVVDSLLHDNPARLFVAAAGA